MYVSGYGQGMQDSLPLLARTEWSRIQTRSESDILLPLFGIRLGLLPLPRIPVLLLPFALRSSLPIPLCRLALLIPVSVRQIELVVVVVLLLLLVLLDLEQGLVVLEQAVVFSGLPEVERVLVVVEVLVLVWGEVGRAREVGGVVCRIGNERGVRQVTSVAAASCLVAPRPHIYLGLIACHERKKEQAGRGLLTVVLVLLAVLSDHKQVVAELDLLAIRVQDALDTSIARGDDLRSGRLVDREDETQVSSKTKRGGGARARVVGEGSAHVLDVSAEPSQSRERVSECSDDGDQLEVGLAGGWTDPRTSPAWTR